MKNNKYVYITIGILLLLTIISMILIFNSKDLDKSIKDIKWYNYDKETGYYNLLEIKNKELIFLTKDKKYKNCTKYRYNSKSETIKLNCKQNIKIDKYDENSLSIIIDNKEYKYFNSLEETLNYEFNKYYEKTILEFKQEKEQVVNLLKINPNDIENLYKQEDISSIVLYNSKCLNIECTLILNLLEKWNVETNNIHIIKTEDLSQNNINYLNSITKEKIQFDFSYPYIITLGNNQVYLNKEIKCNGLSCSNWQNYIKKLNLNKKL